MRFYEEELPKIDDVVICKVLENIDGFGVKVELVEYDGIEGFVSLDEVSKRKVKNLKKVLLDGRTYPLLVLKLAVQRKYIDLSNKYLINQDDYEEALTKYNLYKLCMSVFESISHLHPDIDIPTLLKKTIWQYEKKDVYQMFLDIKRNNQYINEVFDEIGDEEKTILLKEINKHIVETKYKLVKTISIQNYEIDGLEIIRNMLSVIGKKYPDIKITLFNAPNYVLVMENVLDKEKGLGNLASAEIEIQEECTKNDSLFTSIKTEEFSS
jgi:translation initiation factor 2 alpha subunit (eIF-2alpha)